jgi:hypothetical protein
MPNRIQVKFDRFNNAIAKGVTLQGKPIDPEAIVLCDTENKFDKEEIETIRDLTVRALTAGLLTQTEAATIGNTVEPGGESRMSALAPADPTHLNSQPVGTRMALTQLLEELIALRLKNKI